MEGLSLVSNSFGDLYSGYNDFHPVLDSKSIQYDDDFHQTALKSSYGKRLNTGMRTAGPSRTGTAGYRRGSIASVNKNQPPNTARPMTAVRGAGYTSASRPNGAIFDPLNQAKSMSTFHVKDENSPENRIKNLEKKVNLLLEESIICSSKNERKLSLQKAKEVVNKERSLSRQKEQASLDNIPVNVDLTFSVLLNLAIQYTKSEHYSDAVNTYQTIIKNRSFSNTGRLKVNMGNIYFNQGDYPKAIKFFRMALDQIPTSQKSVRMKIMRNIGISFVKLNQFTDALISFEYIIAEKGDYRDALHLILCHYALGDSDKMKKHFLKLLELKADNSFYSFNSFHSHHTHQRILDGDDFDDAIDEYDDDHIDIHSFGNSNNNITSSNHLIDGDDNESHNLLTRHLIKNDQLKQVQKEIKQERDWCILTSAKLIAPVIEETLKDGYDWCTEKIRLSGYNGLANQLEINKSVKHLKKREFAEAIECLKSFEKKESSKAASVAATNLSFLYLLQNDLTLAEKYADEAINTDHYNAGALVNKGNCCFKNQEYDKALEYYKEALSNDADCVEAVYNLALVNCKLNRFDDGLDYFFKMNGLLKNHPYVLYQIAHLYEMINDRDQAMDWYQNLLTFLPSDPSMLNRLSDILEAEGDKQQAFTYLIESYRYYPSFIPTIERIAAHYIENQVYEKATRYLERASNVQPNQVKWQLMIAACHRRSGNYQQALLSYKHIHKQFPDNIECLKFLSRISQELELPEATDYSDQLKKLEKLKEIKERKSSTKGNGSRSTSQSSHRRSAGSSREGSASSNSSGYVTSTSPRVNSSKSGTMMSASSINRIKGLNDNNSNNGNSLDSNHEAERNDISSTFNERPTTSWKRKTDNDDDFENDEIMDMLPE